MKTVSGTMRRPCATVDDLGRAYRAFLGDADERALVGPELLEALYGPERPKYKGGGTEIMPFADFLEVNRRRVTLVPEPIGA